MNEELKIIISATIGKLKENIDKAEKEVKSFKEQVKEASESVDENFQNMGTGMANGAKAAATGLTVATTALLALGASTQGYRNEQAKLVTAFEAAGGSAEQAKDTYNDLFRVLGDSGQATEAASHLAKLTTEEKALSEWTTICQGVYATFGDSLPIESLTESANETAKVGTVTGSLADALNWAGVSEDAFNEKLQKCNTEAEREKLIRDTLNGLYEDAANTYEENNKQVLEQNEAQAELQDTLATLGEVVAPIITAFTSFANDALAVVVPYIQQLAEEYGPALNEALSVVSDTLSTIFGYLVDNWATVLTVAGVVGGIAAAIGLYNTVAAIKAAMDAAQVTTLWALVSAYAAQAVAMAAAIAPYVAIVAAIAAVVAAIVWLIKHWEDLPEYAKAAWEWIKGIWENVGAWFNDNVVTPIINFFSGLWNGIKNIFNNIKGWFSDKFQAAANGIRNAFSSITGFFGDIWKRIKRIFSDVGSAIGQGIKSAVSSAVNSVLSTAIGIINGFIGAINTAIGIINKIPGVEIKKLKKLDVPKMAKGGIVDSATLAVIGEQGKEAVVPLENNTQWMDKLATMLNERMGSSSNAPIVLTVDGKVFAEIATMTINQQTRQTGKLALNLV